jgi:hypothetical protein
MGNEPNPRQHLAECIEANAIALADLHHAELTLQRARGLHCELLTRKAEAFGDLDNQLASARAQRIKQALDAGDNDGARMMLTQPVEGFASAQVAFSQLVDQIAGIEDSLPILEQELADARKAAEMADFHVDQARAAVFAQVADEMAREFHERLHELRLVSIELAAMANRPMRRNPTVQRSDGAPYYGGRSNTIPMPGRVLEAVAEPIMGTFDRKHPPARKNAIASAVASWWAALRSDAEARLDMATKTAIFPSSVAESAAAPADDVSLRQAAE